MAILLKGKPIADGLKRRIRAEVAVWRGKGVFPRLETLLVGGDESSVVYARAKEKVCRELDIEFKLHRFPEGAAQAEVLGLIGNLNTDPRIHGIMVELPLPPPLDKKRVLDQVAPAKDVDGVHPANRGYLMAGIPALYPATPQSCIAILRENGVEIAGRHVVVVGRGETVGKPLIHMLLQQDATVTVCHTRTRGLETFTRQADIVVVAAGKPGLLTRSMIREGAVVVDAGINATASGICGDVDFDGVAPAAAAITPVPGGVGSLTTAFIMRNLLRAVALNRGGEAGV